MLLRIKNGMREWDQLPSGYELLPIYTPLQARDVQRIHETWFLEYPPDGMLISTPRSPGSKWYRLIKENSNE